MSTGNSNNPLQKKCSHYICDTQARKNKLRILEKFLTSFRLGQKYKHVSWTANNLFFPKQCVFTFRKILIVTKHLLVHAILNTYSKPDQNMSRYWNELEHWHLDMLFDCFHKTLIILLHVYNNSLSGVFGSSQYVSYMQLNESESSCRAPQRSTINN